MSREVRDTPRDAPSVPPAPSTPGIQAPLGWSISPSGLAALGILGSLFAAGAGAIGSYAVTGWRVTALESKQASLEADLRAARADSAGQDKRLVSVEADIRALTKGMERIESTMQRIEAKLDNRSKP